MRGRRWIWLLAILPIALGLAQLRLDVEVLNLLPESVSAVRGLKLYDSKFSNGRELIISVEAKDSEQCEHAARTLAERLRTAGDLFGRVMWQSPWLENPAQASEFIAYLWLNKSPPEFQKLVDRLHPTNASRVLTATRERLATSFSPAELARLSYDPFQLIEVTADSSGAELTGDQNLFVSPEGTFRLIFAEAPADLKNYRDCAEWLDRVKARVSDWRSAEENLADVQVRLTGRPAFMAEIGGRMERDIRRSVLGTVAVISLLFWVAHRSWRPLVWLVILMGAILLATFAFGGLIFGELNVVSAGFAAILLGLTVDYALVLFQEHRSARSEPISVIQRKLGPSIFWSALTTASAFAVLNWGGLPGLSQLGSLVAVGTCVAGFVMFFLFLPPLAGKVDRDGTQTPVLLPHSEQQHEWWSGRTVWAFTVLVVLFASTGLFSRGVPVDSSSGALRLRNSASQAAFEQIKQRMNRPSDPLWLIIGGDDESAVADRLDSAVGILAEAKASGEIEGYRLPSDLWPRPAHQQTNRVLVSSALQNDRELLRTAIQSGFKSEALELTRSIFQTWKRASTMTNVFWPENEMSRWVLGKFTARGAGEYFALGLIDLADPEGSATRAMKTRSDGSIEGESSEGEWRKRLESEQIWLAGWSELGRSVLDVVARELKRVLIPIAVLLMVCLWLAFRSVREVLLSCATLAFAGLSLVGLMAIVGWSWNLMNLMAIPLLLGAGVDYSIHILLALRRYGGDATQTRRTIGRALLLCGATTVVGFGSLAWSGNAGLASLGQVCATGIGLTALTAVFLLPEWRRATTGIGQGYARSDARRMTRPSVLYRTDLWRLALLATRWTETRGLEGMVNAAATTYWRLNRTRREIVIENILPAVSGDWSRAEEISRELFRNFGQKLIDLWRYENGRPIDRIIAGWPGWEHFEEARARGRGVLLVTPHLGNWELGAPLLVKKGITPLVVSLVEPHAGLTELRQAARARWGIETLVIGDNPFSFVEVIRRLESGATVALLVDRPPASSAAQVELFGRPFAASIAAAELARASGCAVVPVYLPKTGALSQYVAHVLPEISYDRQRLGSRAEREQFTQQLMRAFEPVIQQHIDQWYHFIPIWETKRV